MPRYAVTYALLLIALFGSPLSFAEKIYPLVTYKCDIGNDVAIITHSLLKSDEGKNYNYSATDGKFSPWNLVDIDNSNDRSKIVKTRKLSRTCELSSGKYTFIIEPQLFGRDLKGRCGASISTAVTITAPDGFEVLERTPFENFCKGNAPVIIRVTTFGKTGEVKIKRIPKYRFY